MGKRKNSTSEEKIRRKIQKLEEKIKKNRKSKDSSEDDSSNEPSNASRNPSQASQNHTLEQESTVQISSPITYVDDEIPSVEQTIQNEVDLAVNAPLAALVESAEEQCPLSDDILAILGDAPQEVTELGPSIHRDVASRWQEILSQGLSKEVKEKLFKEYLVPSNCELLLAPELNPETKAALPDGQVKRDFSLLNKQKQLGLAISALARATEVLLSKEGSVQDVLKPMSDSCRILCDIHFTETRTRRSFVISSVNSNMKETLINTKRGKYLFGDDMSEKLKVAKVIQKSSEALRAPQKKQLSRNDYIQRPARQNHLNWKGPPQRTPNKSQGTRPRQPMASTAAPAAQSRQRATTSAPMPTQYRYRNHSPSKKYHRK